MADKSIIILSLLCINYYYVITQSIDNNNEINLFETRVNTSMKFMERNIMNQLDVMQLDNKNWKLNARRNLVELEQKTDNRLNKLDANVTGLKDNVNSLQKLIILASCKEYITEPSSYIYSNLFTLDYKALRHVTLTKDYDDKITFFEMHIAIKGEKSAVVLLSPIAKPSKNNDDLVFEIGIGTDSNQNTILALSMTNRSPVKTELTPNVLSPSKFVNFYIKISDGTLYVGKEGETTPLLTYKDDRVNTVKYYGFTYWWDKKATFLHDCPALADLL